MVLFDWLDLIRVFLADVFWYWFALVIFSRYQYIISARCWDLCCTATKRRFVWANHRFVLLICITLRIERPQANTLYLGVQLFQTFDLIMYVSSCSESLIIDSIFKEKTTEHNIWLIWFQISAITDDIVWFVEELMTVMLVLSIPYYYIIYGNNKHH